MLTVSDSWSVQYSEWTLDPGCVLVQKGPSGGRRLRGGPGPRWRSCGLGTPEEAPWMSWRSCAQRKTSLYPLHIIYTHRIHCKGNLQISKLFLKYKHLSLIWKTNFHEVGFFYTIPSKLRFFFYLRLSDLRSFFLNLSVKNIPHGLISWYLLLKSTRQICFPRKFFLFLDCYL